MLFIILLNQYSSLKKENYKRKKYNWEKNSGCIQSLANGDNMLLQRDLTTGFSWAHSMSNACTDYR